MFSFFFTEKRPTSLLLRPEKKKKNEKRKKTKTVREKICMKRRPLHVKIAKPDVGLSGLRLSSRPPHPPFPPSLLRHTPVISISTQLTIIPLRIVPLSSFTLFRRFFLIAFTFFLYQRPITTFSPLLSLFFLPLFLERFFKFPAVYHHSHSTLWIQLNLILYIIMYIYIYIYIY